MSIKEQEEIRVWRYLLKEAQTGSLDNVDAMGGLVDLARLYADEERITPDQRYIIGETVMDRYEQRGGDRPFFVN